MHKFMKSIGFTDISKKELENMIQDIIEHPQAVKAATDSEGNEFAELSYEYAPNIGITVRGIYDENDKFNFEYCYPYFLGTNEMIQEQIEVEKHAEKESYAGIFDEYQIGVTIIFYLQNVADYLTNYNKRHRRNFLKGTVLSALASEGKILLPVVKEKRTKKNAYEIFRRNQLIAQAREGNEDAIENLTMEDMDMYSIISRRIEYEDVLTIVSTYFMPYGIESDQYSILADILDYAIVENSYTKESICCMKLSCNGLVFDLCISSRYLMGEPEIGRRFKGNIWLQGKVCMN